MAQESGSLWECTPVMIDQDLEQSGYQPIQPNGSPLRENKDISEMPDSFSTRFDDGFPLFRLMTKR
jgi:hypothetical protein